MSESQKTTCALKITFILFSILISGCSGNLVTTPVTQPSSPERVSTDETRLPLGFWHFEIDPTSGNITASELRVADLHLNATALLEKAHPYSLTPTVLALDPASQQLAVKVKITHTEYEPIFVGFDIHGIVFTHCTLNGWGDADLVMPQDGDTLNVRNPDGYTRWWNPSEFSIPSAGVIGKYVDGKQSMPYTGSGVYDYNGTVNPYLSFIPDITDTFDPLDPFNLNNSIDLVAYFSNPDNFTNQAAVVPGAEVTRIYQFKVSADFYSTFGFNYAVDASWALPSNLVNPTVDDFPPKAHIAEPFLLDVTLDQNTLFWLDDTTYGGTLSYLVRVWDWQNYNDTTYYQSGTAIEDLHGALRFTGRGGFLDGATPLVTVESSDPDTKSVTYRVTYADPPIPGYGLFDTMLIAEHGKTFKAAFTSIDDVFIATYKPLLQSVIVLPFAPEPFQLPYNDPMNTSTDNFWTFREFSITDSFVPLDPQPPLDDPSYYHWGLSTSGESWSSQVHYQDGQQVQDPNGYDLMRNALISPLMIFPDSGAIKVSLTHTFSTEPFDDFGDIALMWVPPVGNPSFHPLYFYHFTGLLPGNISGLQSGGRDDVIYIDRCTSYNEGQVEVFTPTPGGTFRLAFFFSSDADNNSPYLGWEIGNINVEAATPYSGMTTSVFDEHFGSDFPTLSQWQFLDAGSGGEYWGLVDFMPPGNDGTFLDAAYELSSVYGSGINEEAVLTVNLPISNQVTMKIRHRMFLDPGSCAFIGINNISGDGPGQEFLVPYPAYFGALFPYTFTRNNVFASPINPDGNNNVISGYGHFCWTGENPGGFNSMVVNDDELSTYFDLTPFAGMDVDIRFIFRTGDAIIAPFYPFTGTDYATWRIEEVTIKSL